MPEPGPGEDRTETRRAGRTKLVVFGLAASLLLVHGVVCTKSWLHFRTATALEDSGRILEAAREYQSAMGYHAPLNPYCRASAERLHHLVRASAGSDPELAFDLEDRLRRSLRAARSIGQPHTDLLDGGIRPHDPDVVLFLGALAGLVVGLGIWWVPGRSILERAAFSGVAMLLWGLLLYLC